MFKRQPLDTNIISPGLGSDIANASRSFVHFVQGMVGIVVPAGEAAGVATANMANANDVGTASFESVQYSRDVGARPAQSPLGPTAPTWGGPGFAPIASGAPGTPGTETDAWLKAMTQEQTALDRGRTATAVSDWKSATDTMANAFTTFIDKGNKWLDKLLGPGVAGGAGGDITAPGANGPLEGIYRVADVLKNWAKPGVDTAKFAAQYYPGQSMAQAGASAAVNIGQYRAGDLAPLYKAGILNETAVNAAALTPSQLAMTGVTGTLPLGAATAAAGAVKTTGQPQQPQAGIAQGLQGMDLATPLVSTLNALQKNADFLTASNGVGTAMAKNMAAAWVKELPNTPWAGAMEKAIMTDILNAFPKK